MDNQCADSKTVKAETECLVDLQIGNQKLQEQSSETDFKCDYCEVKFKFRATLEKHMLVVHSDDVIQETYDCKQCKFSGTSIEQLKKHETTHKGSKKVYKCTRKFCNRKFLTKAGLDSHLLSHPVDKPFDCDVCDKAFRGKNLLAEHVKLHYNGSTVVCPICNKSFSYKRSLQEHLMRHSDDHPFKCNLCSRKFKTPRCLKSHKQTNHSDSKNYQYSCQSCGLKFKSWGGLGHHLASHNLDTEYKCSYCGKTFLNLLSYKKHVRKEKKIAAGTLMKYSCSECEKKFERHALLDMHKITKHSDLRPYMCSVCKSTFKIANTLSQHRLGHFPKSPYVCEMCGKEFNQQSNLKGHQMRVHKKVVKSYCCDLCGELFQGIKFVTAHITSCHLKT